MLFLRIIMLWQRFLGISSYPFGRQSRTWVGPEVFPETTEFYDNGGVVTAMATWLPWLGFSVCLLQSLYKNVMFLFGSSDFSLAWGENLSKGGWWEISENDAGRSKIVSIKQCTANVSRGRVAMDGIGWIQWWKSIHCQYWLFHGRTWHKHGRSYSKDS